MDDTVDVNTNAREYSHSPDAFPCVEIDAAAYFVARGAELIEVLPPTEDQPHLSVFLFRNTAALADILAEWLRDEPIPPRGLLAKRGLLFRLAKEAKSSAAVHPDVGTNKKQPDARHGNRTARTEPLTD